MSKIAAKKARDSLAKAIYAYLFKHIISISNSTVDHKTPYIGIVDIAGFGME